MPEKKFNLHEMVMEFEKGLTAGTPFDIPIFVKDYDKEDKTKLIEELIYSEIELCLKKNQSRKSADYKNQFPDLFSDQTIALKIINHEVQTLANYDLPIDPKSYFKLFPELEEQLSSLFEKMNLIPPTIPGYTILEEIGRGGMGVVYRAAQHSLKRIVAIKIIKNRAGLGSTMGDQPKKRFIAETSLLASLQHPNVVSIFESGEIKGNRYLVMEFVEGTNTKKILEKGVFDIQKAVSMIMIIANAVHYFNQKGIIHRDLKPENILLTLNGEPKIADFGLAKSLYVDDGMTQDGFLIGTPEYLAPEQAEMDNRKPSPSIDVYGVGAIFYTLLTGNPPFPRSNLLETLNKVKNQEAASVKAQRPETPKDLDTIIRKCLQKKPSARYSSALELAEDLNRFNQGLPIQATTPGILTKLFKYSLRNKLLVLLFASVIAGLFSFFLRTYFFSLEQKKSNSELSDKNDKLAILLNLTKEEGDRADLEKSKAVQLAEELRVETKNALQQTFKAERVNYPNLLRQADQFWLNEKPKLAWQNLNGVRWDFRGWEYRYLCQKFNQDSFVLDNGFLESAEKLMDFYDFTPMLATYGSGKIMACWWGNSIKIRDNEKNLVIKIIPKVTNIISSLEFSDDGCFLVASFQNTQQITVWDVNNNFNETALVKEAANKTFVSSKIAPDGRKLCVFYTNGTFHEMDLKTGSITNQIDTKLKVEKANICFLNKLPCIVGFSINKTIFLFNIATMMMDFEKEDSQGYLAMAQSPDGRFFASCVFDGGINVYERKTETIVKRLIKNIRVVSHVEFSPDGSYLLSVVKGQGFNLWKTDDFMKPGESKEAMAVTCDIATANIFGNSQFVCSTSPDGFARYYEIPVPEKPGATLIETSTNLKISTLTSGGSNIYAIATHPNENIVAQCGDSKVIIWDIENRKQRKVFLENNLVTSLSFDPKGDFLAYCGEFKQIKIIDMKTLSVTFETPVQEHRFSQLKYSGDGKTLAVTDFENKVQFWEKSTKDNNFYQARENKNLEFKGDTLPRIATSWIGKVFALALNIHDFPSKDKIKITDSNTFKIKSEINEASGITTMCFHPDGKSLLLGSNHGLIYVWDLPNKRRVRTIHAHFKRVNSISFNSSGSHFVSGSDDNTLKIWDFNEGIILHELNGQQKRFKSCSFSFDDRFLLSSSQDAIQILDSNYDRPDFFFENPNGSEFVGISYDNTKHVLISVDSTGRFLSWNLHTGKSRDVVNDSALSINFLQDVNSDGTLKFVAKKNFIFGFFPEKFKKIQALHSIQYSKLQNTTQFFHEKFSQLSLGSENYYSAWFHSDQLSKLNSLSLEKRNEYKGRADLYLKKLQGN